MADTRIRNNSPDPTQYHEDVASMPGTMIPRAGISGESLGFNHNVPNRVIVDPGEDGGGFTLDMEALAGTRKKFNSAALRAEVAADPTAFYRGLAEAQNEPTPPQTPNPKDNEMPKPDTPDRADPQESLKQLPPIPSLPDSSIRDVTGPLEKMLLEEKEKAAMREVQDREQMEIQLRSAEATRVTPLDLQNLNQRPVYDGGYHPPPFEPPRSEPSVSPEANLQMVQMFQQMTQQRDAINALISAQTTKSVPAEKTAVVEDKVEEAPEAAAVFLHNIPFLAGDKPQRPQYETYFEMSKMGTMAARYHSVIEGSDCLALIYDTRFEDGFQYLPPSLGEERITVSIPKLDNAVYTCSSLGLHWTLGCMDVVILIKHEEEGE
jgi:hypothetical protein